MQSNAANVKAYLADLPAKRRSALKAVRNVILQNLDASYEEGMQYGMIGYYVPHRVYPGGYHCDPKQPLPFAGLASQKNHMSIYLMCLYVEGEDLRWFKDAWAKADKKLDMGKCCIRFIRLDDLPLDLIGRLVKRVPAKKYIKHYEASLRSNTKRREKAAKAKKSIARKPARAT